MNEMKVVVNITKREWEYLNKLVENGDQLRHYERLLVNGTPLPKGHGKIGDLTKLYNEIDTRNKGKNKGKYTGILALVGFADTIIEADKGDE